LRISATEFTTHQFRTMQYLSLLHCHKLIGSPCSYYSFQIVKKDTAFRATFSSVTSTNCFVKIAPPSKCEMGHTHARSHTQKVRCFRESTFSL